MRRIILRCIRIRLFVYFTGGDFRSVVVRVRVLHHDMLFEGAKSDPSVVARPPAAAGSLLIVGGPAVTHAAAAPPPLPPPAAASVEVEAAAAARAAVRVACSAQCAHALRLDLSTHVSQHSRPQQ